MAYIPKKFLRKAPNCSYNNVIMDNKKEIQAFIKAFVRR